MQEAAGDHELLLHPAGELAGQLVGLVGDLELLQQGLHERLVVGDAVDAGDERQMLANRQIVEEPRLVGKERERALGRDRIGGQVDAGDADVPPLRGMMPARQRSVVVFPAPLGPTRPSTSPGRTANDRSRTAVNSP